MQWRAFLVGLVVVSAIAGFSIAGVPGTALTGATPGPNAAGTDLATALANTPLTRVAGSASGLSPTETTTMGTVTVAPDDAAFNPNAPDSVTVTLAPRGSLSELVNEQSDVASPLYRHFLSASMIGAEYGNPSYAAVESYFSGFGLKVLPSATALTLTLSGTVAQVAAAFHTTLSPYSQSLVSHGVWNPGFGNASGLIGTTVHGPVIYANTAPAELPSGIAGVVNGIAGLDQMAATPELSLPAGLGPSLPALNNTTGPSPECEFGVFGSCTSELDLYQSLNAHNFLWTNFSSAGASCADENVCGAHQFLFPSTLPALTGAVGLWNGKYSLDSERDRGQGITIALIEVGCAQPSDLSAWSNMTFAQPNELDNRLTQIALNVPGLEPSPNTNLNGCLDQGFDAGWTLESSLDVEYAAAEAPLAHIDLIGIPDPGNFSAFLLAYADVAQYLSLGSTGGSCASAATLAAAGLHVVEGTLGTGTCSVTITSNSYGEGEEYEYFYGSPIYLTADDQELELLNAVGVTNFFASGDGGGTLATVNDFTPAESPGGTSVGGAQITAQSAGSEFPVTNASFAYCDGFLTGPSCEGANGTAYFAPATGIGSTGYWAYAEGLSGTETGVEGGGFGQSFAETQPWWQNALDSYSTGARIDPVVSVAAAFNMTIYGFGGWYILYGGTSFACPTMAGMWALVEEQAGLAFGNPEIGDANPLLYATHNAFEAGALHTNPYVPEGPTTDWTAAPVNSFTWYYYNLSIEEPSAPVQPLWFPSLGNPAGPGWNYLAGLGIPDAARLSDALFGTTGAAGHALANPAFSIVENSTGGLLPAPTTLVAGTNYSFQVLSTGGVPGVYDVTAYSGMSNNGTYGGGVATVLQTGANGRFNYVPSTGAAPGGDAATTYGYFLVKSVVGGADAEWSFDDFAVAAPTPSGSLTLCVVDAYGNCDTGTAEVTTFTTTTVGDYNLFGQAEVYLNGLPVAVALVTQVSVETQFGDRDASLPPADYAPGMTLGTTISDARGEAVFWIDGFTAEHNGSLATDVYTLQATYDGLVSQNVTVYAEPQSGSFYTAGLNESGSSITGRLSFAGMKYVDSVNVSVGGGPGQYQNWTCPLPGGASQPANTLLLPGCSPFEDTQFGANLWESGVDHGALVVHLNTTGVAGPVVVSVVGIGANDVSFGYCETFDGFTSCFVSDAIQSPMTWLDPLVFLPASLTASPTTSDSGSETVTWSGAPYLAPDGHELARGTLTLQWAGGSELLASGLSGSYTLDTATLANGAYSVVFSETAPGAATTTRSVSFYVDNAPVAPQPPTASPGSGTSPSSSGSFGYAELGLLATVAALGVVIAAGVIYGESRRAAAVRAAPPPVPPPLPEWSEDPK